MVQNLGEREEVSVLLRRTRAEMEMEGLAEPDRELYRRYRKRRSSAGFLFPQGVDNLSDPTGNIEVEEVDTVKKESSFEQDYTGITHSRQSPGWKPEGWKRESSARLGSPIGSIPIKSLHEDHELRAGFPSVQTSVPVLKVVKQEPEELSDSGESSFSRFAAVLQAALQGFTMFPDLILQFEKCCKDLAEQVREEATERHRAIEDRLMRQKAQMLHHESATWALIWHLFGEGPVDMDVENETIMSTSQQEAHKFISTNETAQLCSRIVKWLEGLSSKALDLEKKYKGWYAGSYLQKLGVWHQTQRAIKRLAGKAVLVQHLDPDASTREQARLDEEDQKLEEGLLEDIWKLLRAGRLGEARQLCRSAGQPWRAATLGGCGNVGPTPSAGILGSQTKDRPLQAVELESGIGHQRFLWKWTCFSASEKIADNPDESRYEAAVYALQCGNLRRMLPVCRDWESACWAMVKSWLQVQVDMDLARIHAAKVEQLKGDRDAGEMSEAIVEFNTDAVTGPESWPQHVVDQQPRDLSSLFQKLQAGDMVHENVSQSCKDPQRQIQMCIMLGEFGQLLDLLRDWIVPPQDQTDFLRSHGHPQMIRLGAHLVLVLRHILSDNIKEQFKEKLWLVGDLILNTYAIFLFTQGREELVGVYAAQLAPYLCEELYLHMMELRQNDSALVKYKILRSALENLPFNAGDPLKGCVANILDRVLSRSREVRCKIKANQLQEVENFYQQENLRKAVAVQWLCFTPPSNLANPEQIQIELLGRAVKHSNILLREFALSSLRRDCKLPVGAHMLLGYMVEPFKQPLDFSQYDEHNIQENILEFQEWREYFTCDALYRNWLKLEMENAQIISLSSEEHDRALTAANQAIGATTSFIKRKGFAWVTASDVVVDDLLCIQWIELHAVALLVSPSGKCLIPDATICTALRSALYSCVGEDVVIHRQLMVEASVNGDNDYCINVHLRCLPEKGDGIGFCSSVDGGLLAAVMATAIKGELEHFQVGLSLEVSKLDAWFVDKDGKYSPAAYIMQGLCHRCCLPELILRCMQMTVSLVETEFFVHEEEDLLEFIASSEHEVHRLFSCRQLQEFLLLEREYTLQIMELAQSSG